MPYDRKTKVKMTPGARVLVGENSAYFVGREVTLVGYEGSADYPRMARVKTDDKLTALLPVDFLKALPTPAPSPPSPPAPKPLEVYDIWLMFFAPDKEKPKR